MDVLEVHGLSVSAGSGHSATMLVQDLSFTVAAGEVLGIVGESGSGKSMTAYAIGSLLPRALPSAPDGSSSRAAPCSRCRRRSGARWTATGSAWCSRIPCRPSIRCEPSVPYSIESATRHQGLSAAEARRKVVQALAGVHLPRAELLIDAYPHQLSGGQRQRAMIALALLNGPSLVVADEPTTALDATVQLQILALLKRGAGSRALLLITHDLAVASTVCDRILVMQRGRCVEQGPIAGILDAPAHEYTRELLAAACWPTAFANGSPAGGP